MKLIVGLGNPGEKYAKTRHNVGWFALDALARELNVTLDKEGFKGLYAETVLDGEEVILLKPMTYMNLSGESIKLVMEQFNLSILDVLVIYDEMDFETGVIKLRYKGGASGHNGIKNIIQNLGKKDFNRIRIGISRPEKDLKILDYVLGEFKEEEVEKINASVSRAKEAAIAFIKEPFDRIMSRFNK